MARVRLGATAGSASARQNLNPIKKEPVQLSSLCQLHRHQRRRRRLHQLGAGPWTLRLELRKRRRGAKVNGKSFERYTIGPEGSEHVFSGKVQLLDRSVCKPQ